MCKKKQKPEKTKPEKIKKNNKTEIEKFKQKYFDFYDDIKDYTKGKEDW